MSRSPNKPNVRDFNKEISLTKSQKEFAKKIHENQLIFCHGPAGTAKTFTACYTAMKLLIDKGNGIDKIILTKPIEESGEKLGSLPGHIDEKTAPYLESYKHNFGKIINNPERVEDFFWNDYLIFKPLAYMRGVTFDHSIMILDESQNCDYRQLMLFISRMGLNSKVIICGDVSQYDIKENMVVMNKFIDIFKNVDGIVDHEFTNKDIVRSELLIKITEIYEENKSDFEKDFGRKR